MTTTRIAGTAYDAQHADQVTELARIHTYATRIRHIARKAAGHVSLPDSAVSCGAPVTHSRSRSEMRAPHTAHEPDLNVAS